MVVKYGKNTIYEKLLGRKEREIEGKERQKREMRDLGVRSPRFYFSGQPGHAGEPRVVLEHGRVPDSSFHYPRSMGVHARAWLSNSKILVFPSSSDLQYSSGHSLTLIYIY